MPDKFIDDGIVCPACRGSGRQITEDSFRSCTRCGGTGEWRPDPHQPQSKD